jgi:hypothetical protein
MHNSVEYQPKKVSAVETTGCPRWFRGNHLTTTPGCFGVQSVFIHFLCVLLPADRAVMRRILVYHVKRGHEHDHCNLAIVS